MRRKHAARKLLEATEGLVATATDLVLFLTILPFALPGAYTHGQVSQRIQDVLDLVGEDINYRTMKQTIVKLVAAGLISKKQHRNALDIAITNLGRKRIESIVPTYQENRPWDGHLYLVSYDIPAKPKIKRDMLRQYLRRIGAKLLQESLWLTPYNPRDLVNDFVQTHGVGGSILVSKLGTDGAIGEETIPDLIRRVYALDTLNERYAEFIETYKDRKHVQPIKATIDYLSLLKADPQLPFTLLPKDFLGEKAYRLHQTLTENKSS